MPTSITPLSELPLSDDFMFGEVMRHPDVCKLFLEALLEKEISHIEYIRKQEDLTDDLVGHGIRLDVYLNDAAGTHYDIEMQKTSSRGLERRIRYYQSGIDRRCLEKGLDYVELPESYIIFLCDFDHYRAGLARYERVCSIKGQGDIVYDDGSHAIILNSRYQEGNASQPILEFLDYIRTNDDQFQAASELMQKARRAVQSVRCDKTKEVPYMTWAMKTRDLLRQGREEGIEIGREEGIEALIATMRDMTATQAQAVQALIKRFRLLPDDAEKRVAKYWEQNG